MRLERAALEDLLAGEPCVAARESGSLARLCEPLAVCDLPGAQSLMCGWLLVKGPEGKIVAHTPEVHSVLFGVPLCELAAALVRATGCPHVVAWRHLEAELNTDLRAHLWAMAEQHRDASAAGAGARVAVDLHLEACLKQRPDRAQPRVEARQRKLPLQLASRAVGALGAACLFFSGVSELRRSRTSPPTAETAELCRRGPRELLAAMLDFGARGLRLQLGRSDGTLSDGTQRATRLELHCLARALRALEQSEFRRAAAEAERSAIAGARRPDAGQLTRLRGELVAARAAAWPALTPPLDDAAQFSNCAVAVAATQGAKFARQPAVGLEGVALDAWSPRCFSAPSESAWSGSTGTSLGSAEEPVETPLSRDSGAPRPKNSPHWAASSAASNAETVRASPTVRKRDAVGEAHGSPSGGSPRLGEGPCSAHGPCAASVTTESFARCWVGVPRPLGGAGADRYAGSGPSGLIAERCNKAQEPGASS